MMGSGGVGGFVGARLLETGHDVTFVARGAHLTRPCGIAGYACSAKTDRVGCFGSTWLNGRRMPGRHSISWCLRSRPTTRCRPPNCCAPRSATQTAVLTLQNGIDNVPMLSSVVGAEHVIGGATWLTAHIAEPGVIEFQDALVRAAIGEPGRRVYPTVRRRLERRCAPAASKPRSATTSTGSCGARSCCSRSMAA